MAKILFCDEDHALLETFGRYLSWYGHEVALERDPQVLAQALARFKPDLLILNAWIGTRAPYRILEALRRHEDPELRGIQVLLLIVEDLDASKRKLARRLGASLMNPYRSAEKWQERIDLILEREAERARD